MQMSAGWEYKNDIGDSTYVIKLKKNLYGTVTGARNWYNILAKGLEARGLKTSSYNPCLFMREDFMIVVYIEV